MFKSSTITKNVYVFLFDDIFFINIFFSSHKNYSPEIYEENPKLMKTSFKRSWQPVILHLVKKKHIKGTSQNWFDAQIMEKISNRDKLFKKFKSLACMSIKITIRKQGMRHKN